MTDTTTPAPDRPRLAYHHTTGTGPTIVFLSGYGSDMTSTSVATAFEVLDRKSVV